LIYEVGVYLECGSNYLFTYPFIHLSIQLPIQIIQRYRDRLDTCVKRQANVDAVILDPDVLQRSIQFYCTLAEWLSLQAAGEGG